MIEKITPQPTEDNPLTIDGYPYGFRLRTKAQYWIETIEERGQRTVFRTLNPKTQQWNKPKKSTYSDILVLYRNLENNHVESDGLNFAYADEEDLTKFLKQFPENGLSEYQKERLIYFRAVLKTRKHLKVNIVSNPTSKQIQQIEENNKKTNEDLHKIFLHYYKTEKQKHDS